MFCHAFHDSRAKFSSSFSKQLCTTQIRIISFSFWMEAANCFHCAIHQMNWWPVFRSSRSKLAFPIWANKFDLIVNPFRIRTFCQIIWIFVYLWKSFKREWTLKTFRFHMLLPNTEISLIFKLKVRWESKMKVFESRTSKHVIYAEHFENAYAHVWSFT